MNRLLVLLGLCISFSSFGQKELNWSNLDSVFVYADQNSSVSKANAQQILLARYEKLASVANIINLRSPVAFNLTNNTQLPVSFIPSNLLGGPPGTFREITLGQEYVSNLNITPQIDIINLGAWSRVRSAELNQEFTLENNQLSRKTLFESIAATFYNILSLQEQIEITRKNALATDTLLNIVNDKYAQGLVRKQDVNDAMVNKINLEDKINQLSLSLDQQYTSLKILCDVPVTTKVSLTGKMNYADLIPAAPPVSSQLQFKASVLQSEMAKADLRTNRLLNMPVLSLLYSHSDYQNSNEKFFDENKNNPWLTTVYFGAKISMNLPDINQIVNARNSKVSYKLAQITMEHTKIQNDGNNTELQMDYEKGISQLAASKEVWKLKEENYRMARNQYDQSVIPFDKVLLAFTDMEGARLSYSAAMANIEFLKSKIDINNKLN